MEQLETTVEITAPPEVVWEVMTDHLAYAAWTKARSVTLSQKGSPDPNGLGAIRVFDAGIIKIREEVTVFEPPTTMSYRMLNSFPARDYQATMVLEPTENGSRLHWTGSFRPTIPGTGSLLAKNFAGAVDHFAEGIKARAEEQATA